MRPRPHSTPRFATLTEARQTLTDETLLRAINTHRRDEALARLVSSFLALPKRARMTQVPKHKTSSRVILCYPPDDERSDGHCPYTLEGRPLPWCHQGARGVVVGHPGPQTVYVLFDDAPTQESTCIVSSWLLVSEDALDQFTVESRDQTTPTQDGRLPSQGVFV